MTMVNNFIDSAIDIKNIIKQEADKKTCLYENNFKQIDEIVEFLTGKEKFLFVNGFLGTGKGEILDKVFSYLNQNTITLDYTAFETTVLDDILLTFFDNFKKLTALGTIEAPKVKSENFTQKIVSYFQSIKNPVIIRINSWQNILKDNRTEILDFLINLSKLENTKIVMVSRKFDWAQFDGKISYKKVTILALEKHLFEKYIKSEDIKLIGPISDEFYKYTKGYYLYTALAVKIMRLRHLELIDFISGYTKSMLSFNDFIFREGLSLVDPVSGHLFRFLALIRHPISINLLKALNLYDEAKINFFIDNLVLYKLKDLIYLPEHYKVIAQNSIAENIAVKIHKSCIELYETQLPLKPLERDMLISRNTMRKEIEYHNTFIPQKPRFVTEPLNGAKFAEYPKPIQKNTTDKNINNNQTAYEQSKDAIKKVSFIFDENTLSDIADSINSIVDSSHENAVNEQEIRNLTVVELINLAKIEEENFNYTKVVAILQKALTLKNDEDFYTFLSTIYAKLASTYKKLSDWFSAIKYYELAIEFYEATGDIIKLSELKFEIANIYYETFKHDKAKELLKEIIQTEGLPNNLMIKTYLLISNIDENNKNQDIIAEYYEKALTYIDSKVSSEILSELYYKYAALNDLNLKLNTAIEYYKKCINLGNNSKLNPYLSAAYSNLSILCEDAGQSQLSVKYAINSLKTDENASNYNGIYSSSIRLAEIYKKTNIKKAFEYLKNAQTAAEKLNEPFYIASSNVATGDLYLHEKDYVNALKHYNKALEIAKNNFKKENISKIEMRINDVKLKLGKGNFEKLEQELANNGR